MTDHTLSRYDNMVLTVMSSESPLHKLGSTMIYNTQTSDSLQPCEFELVTFMDDRLVRCFAFDGVTITDEVLIDRLNTHWSDAIIYMDHSHTSELLTRVNK